jgi:AcrR family transcriptional regulator
MGRGRPRTFDEDEVLGAVAEKFWERGYAATSLSEIMDASGLGKGSIYAAFGDKDAIFTRVFDRYCADVTAAVTRKLDGPQESALQRLHDLLLTAARRSPGSIAQRACFLAKTTAELAEHRPQIAQRSRQAFADLAETITGCVAAAQRAGDIASQASPVQLGNHVLVVLRGIEALAEAGVETTVLLDAATVAIETLGSPNGAAFTRT